MLAIGPGTLLHVATRMREEFKGLQQVFRETVDIEKTTAKYMVQVIESKFLDILRH